MIIQRNNSWELPKPGGRDLDMQFPEANRSSLSQCEMTFSKTNYNKTVKISTQRDNSKSRERGGNIVNYKGMPIKLSVDSSAETLRVRRK